MSSLNTRILLINRMLRIVLVPVLANTLSLHKSRRTTHSVKDIILTLEDLHAEAWFAQSSACSLHRVLTQKRGED